MSKNWKAIVAVAENGVIGNGLQIPWHIPADFKHFKATTMGGVIVMGRNTWESFKGKPLLGRENVVVSSTLVASDGIKVFKNLDEVRKAYENDSRQVWIIGGAKLYKDALPFCEELILSKVKMKPVGDVLFPDISKDFRLDATLSENDNFDVLKYVRKSR